MYALGGFMRLRVGCRDVGVEGAGISGSRGMMNWVKGTLNMLEPG